MFVCVCTAGEDYLRDGLYKTDAIVSSLDLNQAVTEIIPVVFPLAKKGCLLFLVELINTQQLIIALGKIDNTAAQFIRCKMWIGNNKEVK